MTFAKKMKYNYGIKICSFLLILMIVLSMLYVGEVRSVAAEGDTLESFNGQTIFFDTQNISDWDSSSAISSIWCEITDDNNSDAVLGWILVRPQAISSNNLFKVTIPDYSEQNQSIKKIIIMRINPAFRSYDGDTYNDLGAYDDQFKTYEWQNSFWSYNSTINGYIKWNQSVDITIGIDGSSYDYGSALSEGNNLIKIQKTSDTAKPVTWESFDSPENFISGGTTIYVDGSGGWATNSDVTDYGVLMWDEFGNTIFHTLNVFDKYSNIFYFTIDDGVNCTGFKLLRFYNNTTVPQDGSTGLVYYLDEADNEVYFKIGDITLGKVNTEYINCDVTKEAMHQINGTKYSPELNCISLKGTSNASWTSYTPPEKKVFVEKNKKFYLMCWTNDGCMWANSTEQIKGSDYGTVLAIGWEEIDGTKHLEKLKFEGRVSDGESYVYSFSPSEDAYTSIVLYRLKRWVDYEEKYGENGFGWSNSEPDSGDYSNIKAIGVDDVGGLNTHRVGENGVATNCIGIATESYYEWKGYYPGVKTFSKNNIIVGFENGRSSTGYGFYEDGNNIELITASATFYDYLTDNELLRGWRTNDDFTAPRGGVNRVPFMMFNNYISSLVGGEGGEWKFPLYFGNFVTYITDFSDYRYGTARNEQIICGSDTYLNNIGSKNFTGGYSLFNFSITANDSNPVRLLGGNYNVSFQGLVDNELDSSGNLTVANGTVKAPYFSQTTVNKGYANRVDAQFPLRVVNHEETKDITDEEGNTIQTTVEYKTYEFDSGKSSADDNDNVYFEYDTNGKPTTIKYGFGTKYGIYDEGTKLASGTHSTGFFPFDTNSVTGDGDGQAYDFGFGMKLNFDFTLSKDGKITGTDKPMTFEFEGDDDVWVFIDGKLALDLGGDHGAANGIINFADRISEVTTGKVVSTSTPEYGKAFSDMYAVDDNSQTDLSSILIQNENGQYDVSQTHTLTLFYMERGLGESNLKINFSMMPVVNQLAVNKEVDYCDVNGNETFANAVKAEVDEIEFAFNITDDKGTDDDYYYYAESLEDNAEVHAMQYSNNGNEGLDFALKNGQSRIFNQGFTEPTPVIDDDGNIVRDEGGNIVYVENSMSNINITENIPDGYTFETTYSITDLSNGDSLVKSDSGTSTVSFGFVTGSQNEKAPVDINVDYTNKVDVGSVTVTKELENDTQHKLNQTEYNFSISVELPEGTTLSEFNCEYYKYDENMIDMHRSNGVVTDGKFTLKAKESITIYGIPKGSEVTVIETDSGWSYTDKITVKDPEGGEDTESDTDVTGYYYTTVEVDTDMEDDESESTGGTLEALFTLNSNVKVTFTNEVVISPEVKKSIAAGKIVHNDENNSDVIVGLDGNPLEESDFSSEAEINVIGGGVAVWKITTTLRNDLQKYSEFIFDDTGDFRLDTAKNFTVTAKIVDESGTVTSEKAFTYGTDYTVVDTSVNDAETGERHSGFTLTFIMPEVDKLGVLQGSKIEIIYTTAINTDEFVEGYDYIINNVKLKYGGDDIIEIDDPPVAKTASVVIGKVDSEGVLIYEHSAKFNIYNCEDGKPIGEPLLEEDIKSVDAEFGNKGAFRISGMVDGTYCIVETTAPKGYSLNDCCYIIVINDLALDVEETNRLNAGLSSSLFEVVNKEEATGEIKSCDCDCLIYNYAKTELPSTGGSGIAVIAMMGVMLVAVSLILLQKGSMKIL